MGALVDSSISTLLAFQEDEEDQKDLKTY